MTPEQWEAWEQLARRLGVADGRGRGGVSAAMARVIGAGVERLAGVVGELDAGVTRGSPAEGC